MKAPNFIRHHVSRGNSRLADKDAPHYQKLLKRYRAQKQRQPE
jgi:hypothetical protein